MAEVEKINNNDIIKSYKECLYAKNK